jgi:uncharacterized protein YkwD
MRRSWSFNGGRDGFGYADDAFRFTAQAKYAGGAWAAGGGPDGSGTLRVTLGGIDNADIARMSGGWERSFTLDAAEHVVLTFRVRLTQSNAYEAGEFSEALVALDGVLVGTNGRDHVARVAGDGAGGPARTTGWKLVTLDLGELGPGRHELTLGGFSNRKTDANETTTLLIDDVVLRGAPAGPRLAAFEARVLELTNEFRAAHGKEPFANDAKLNAAAEDWSRSMAKGDFFRHSSPAQVEEHGYDWRAWGENIAAGYATPEAVVQGWINSPGHRANLLSDSFREIGIGHYFLADDPGSLDYHHYWTQVFGTEAGQLIA